MNQQKVPGPENQGIKCNTGMVRKRHGACGKENENKKFLYSYKTKREAVR